MQPLKVMVSPSSGSVMGWDPCSERSIIFSRRKARARGPLAHTPLPSGPRSSIQAPIRTTVSTSAAPPTRSSPAKPHISLVLQYPGVFEATSGGGVYDTGAGARHPREATRHHVPDGREHEQPQVYERLLEPAPVVLYDVGGEVEELLGDEVGGILLDLAARLFEVLSVGFGAYDEALPPVALARLQDQLPEAVQHFLSLVGLGGGERGGVLDQGLLPEITLYHGRDVGEDGLVVGHPDARGVDEVDLALAVDGVELGEACLYIVLVEAAVDHVYPPPVGAVPDLAATHLAI